MSDYLKLKVGIIAEMVCTKMYQYQIETGNGGSAQGKDYRELNILKNADRYLVAGESIDFRMRSSSVFLSMNCFLPTLVRATWAGIRPGNSEEIIKRVYEEALKAINDAK